MLRSSWIAGVVVGGVLVAGAVPAGATDVEALGWISHKEPMPGVSEAFWAELVGPTAPEWKPEGRKIGGLKFNPKHDGLFFFNYANKSTALPNKLNTYLWGVGTNVVNLGKKQMIDIFGRDQVCLPTKNSKKKCVLSGGANAWMEGINQAIGGGHCFGIATTVAKLYDGSLKAHRLGGKKDAHSIPFKPKATGTIAQNWSLQALVNTSNNLTPKQAFKVLKQSFKTNDPLVMVIRDSAGGGHAITPIGLYKRGKDKYDIAIYDNNYPDRVRAVHADMSLKPGTKKQVGFDYTLFTAPGQPPTSLAGNIGLIPIEKLTGKYDAPFDLKDNRTTVSIDPNDTGNRLKVKITRPDGKPIKGLKKHHPVNGTPDGVQTFPRYTVPAGTPFKLELSNAGNDGTASTAVRVSSGDATAKVTGLNLVGHSVDTLVYRPKGDTLRYDSTGGTDPALEYRNEVAFGREAALEIASVELPPSGGFVTKFNAKRGTFTYQPTKPSPTASEVEFQLEQVSTTKGGKAVLVVTEPPAGTQIPAGGFLKWDYLSGNPRATDQTVELVGPDGTSILKVKGRKHILG